MKIFDFDPILDVFWPFFGHLGAILDLIWTPFPPKVGGTGQNAPKTGPNRPKMRFGAILDHLEAIGDHSGPFGKV